MPTTPDRICRSKFLGHSVLYLQQGEAVLKIAEQMVPVLINFVEDAEFNLPVTMNRAWL
jgi:hypothetical protein